MRAAFVERLGPPDAIRYGDLPAPEAGPTDALVRVRATTVNPVDTFVRSGLYRTDVPLPFVIGRDLVGTVVEAGPGVPGFAPGDEVWCNSLGHAGRQGAAAELAVVPGDRLYRLPPGADPLETVAVVHPGATAALALFTHGGLRAGETVLVGGAAGNVGSAAVVMAAEAGARVVATARPDDFAHCRALGASEVVDYREPAAVPAGIDLWVDTSGVNDLTTAVRALAHRGRIVLLAGARTTPSLPAGELYTKDGRLLGFVISRATTAELAEAAATVNRLVATGRLSPRRLERLPLSQAAAVHHRLERGELHGRRVVLEPS